MDRWQWQPNGDSRPTEYEIKVVVYRDTYVKKVQKMFPISQSEKKDYRYVTYSDAIKYLNNMISDNIIDTLTEKLKKTRLKIINELGVPEK